jgi:putative transcriptional regulator
MSKSQPVATNKPAVADSLGGGDDPLTDANIGVVSERQSLQVKGLRRTLGLTQEEFCARFRIPLGTLRDWEQGRSEPDKPAKAYLQAIAGDADAVSRALQSKPH